MSGAGGDGVPQTSGRSEPVRDVWRPPGPYDLRGNMRTFRRSAVDPCAIFDGGAWWFAFYTGTGPTTLRLIQVQGDVHAAAWGPGAAEAIDGLPRLLGSDDDWTEFDSPTYQATLPEPVRLARRYHPGLRFPVSGRVMDVLIPVILEQKVTGTEAFGGYGRLLARFGSAAPGPAGKPARLRLPPTTAEWLRIPSWEWHRAGVGPQRSDTVMRALARASALARLGEVSATEASSGLRSIPGVGVWSAAEVTQVTHGDSDAISVGDYHLAHFVGHALTGTRTDDAGMLELLQPWAGHRQRIVRLLYLSGIREPRRAPRLSVRDYRSF